MNKIRPIQKNKKSPNFLFSETEGIKYIGSKKDLLEKIVFIVNLLNKYFKIETCLDGFSGSTRVSQILAKNNYRVFSNDTAVYSKVFAETYLKTQKEKSYFVKKIADLNKLRGKIGWFSKLYGGDGSQKSSIGLDGKKKMWQLKNTKKLDAIIEKINKIDDQADKNVLLTSLILALDKVDSSLGHQVSYLKNWSARSYHDLHLEIPNYQIYNKKHQIYNENILDLIKKIKVDLAYFDPPYCSNNEKMPASRVRYYSYYHIWTSICKNDKTEVFGAANRRKDTSDREAISVFEEFKKDDKSNEYITTLKIKELIQNTQAKFILFSYSNNGRTHKKKFIEILNKLNLNFLFYEFNYKKNIMYALKSTNQWINEKENREFLILIDKTGSLNLNKINQEITINLF